MGWEKISKRKVHEIFPELRHLPRRQLLSLLSSLKEGIELNDNYYGRDLLSQYYEHFDRVSCEETFPLADSDKTFTLKYADPGLLVQYVLSQSPTLASVFADKLQGASRGHWKVIVGFDEFQPGDKLDFDRSKAIMCLYFNYLELLEFGDCTWFTPVVIRTAIIDQIEGGWSRIIASILHRMFRGASGLQTAGVAFEHEGRAHLVHGSLAVLISDGDGHRKAVAWRGANSLKPSIIHNNILKKNSDLVSRMTGAVEISCSDHRLLHKTTEAEFNTSVDLVAG